MPHWQEMAIQRHTREALLRELAGHGVDMEIDALVARVAAALDLDAATVQAVLDGMIANGEFEVVR